MAYSVHIYVDKNGDWFGASQTDQCHNRNKQNRTRHGEPVESAGYWYGSQMSYRPFQLAINLAAKKAAERKTNSLS